MLCAKPVGTSMFLAVTVPANTVMRAQYIARTPRKLRWW